MKIVKAKDAVNVKNATTSTKISVLDSFSSRSDLNQAENKVGGKFVFRLHLILYLMSQVL